MSKTTRLVLVLALALVSGLALWNANTYPRIGQVAMAVGGQLEARIHGLTEKTVQVGDVPYRVYEGGNPANPTLVLLHGYSADKDVWPRFASTLVDRYHVIIPDLLGHGETGYRDDWQYSVPSQSQHVLALMEAMHVMNFHVIGNSMGGFIAAYLGLTAPDQVLSVVAIDPAGVVSPTPSKMEHMLAKGRNPFEVHNADEFVEFYGMTMAKPPYLPRFVLDGMAQTYQERRPELARIVQDFRGKDMLDKRLREIKVPFLLIWGSKDELLDVSSVQVWQQGVPGIQVHLFPELGHMPMVEAPAETATVVKSFLTQI